MKLNYDHVPTVHELKYVEENESKLVTDDFLGNLILNLRKVNCGEDILAVLTSGISIGLCIAELRQQKDG